jgi:hypothetical protein
MAKSNGDFLNLLVPGTFAMENYVVKTMLIFCVSILIASCDKPECKNSNPVFDKYSAETKEYKDELVRQLKLVDSSKLSYWLEKYQETDNLQYLHVNIQGDDLCAMGMVRVEKWDDKLEAIRKTKGIGYRGAELVNLKTDVLEDSAKTELIYRSVDAIID